MTNSAGPTCFPPNVFVAVSSKADGTMLDRTKDVHDARVVANRKRFCQTAGIDYADVVYQRIVYGEKRTYNLLCEVDDGSTQKHTREVVADGTVTQQKQVALMLPVADCSATVLHDPGTNTLALLHLGRHSTLTPLLARTIAQMVQGGAKAKDIVVWMSPSARASHYVMRYFDHADSPDWQQFCTKEADGYHLDLPSYNRQVCLQNGVLAANIHLSPINTFTNPNYFSHAAGDTTGRFVVVAKLR